MKKHDTKTVTASRRDFVKGAAMGAVAWPLITIGGQEVQAAEPPRRWDHETSILIAGGGVSGCSAAIAAADAGDREVLVIEKMGTTGGSGVFSSGTIIAADTPMQREKGIKDSADRWYNEAMDTSENGVDPKVTRTLVEGSNEVWNFLHAAGMRWSFIDELPGYSAPRGYREAGGGKKMMNVIAAEMKKRAAITVLLETRVSRLFADKDGQVVGVEIMDAKNQPTTVRAKKGVAICTGDYAANPRYIESHFPQLKDTKFVGNAGNTGDGIRMAQRLGADITGYNAQGHPHCVEVAPGKAVLWSRYEFLAEDGLILVNAEGKRFCNEPVKAYYVPLFPEVQKQGGKFACVFDEAAAKAVLASPRFDTTFRGHTALFRDGLKGDGYVIKKADSIEALAKLIGIDPAGLAKTVAEYNANAAKGTDPQYQRDAKFLKPIVNGPFYGWKGVVGVTTTRGGLRMDPDARILDVDLKPIPRLYGAGATIGGYTNEAGYRSGWHLNNALVFGRIAGKRLAAEKPMA